MSKRFCPIPWNSMSILPDGRMRLCCHADTDHLVLDKNGEDLNISELSGLNDYHKNEFLSQIRTKFNENEGVAACKNCVKQESLGNISPRNELNVTYKKVDSPAINFLDISFSNFCNMQCPMCSPIYSSVWAKKSGHEELNKKHAMSIEFINSDIFSELFSNLDMILIQGGEPFLAKEHIPFLKRLIELGSSNKINLDYVTNNSIRVSGELKELWKKFKHVNLFISVESSGPNYGFTRPPQKWEKFYKNTIELEQLTREEGLSIKFQFKSVLQIYNFYNLDEFLKDLNEFSHFMPVIPEFTNLHFPRHLKISQIPKSFRKDIVLKIKNNIKNLNLSGSFEETNKNNLETLLNQLNHIEKMEDDSLDEKFWSLTNYFRLSSNIELEKIFGPQVYEALKS